MVSHVIKCDNTKCRVHGISFTLYRDTIMNMTDGVDCLYNNGGHCSKDKINGDPQPLCDYIANMHLLPGTNHTTSEVFTPPDIVLSDDPPQIPVASERKTYPIKEIA